jgi:hypothetical protein
MKGKKIGGIKERLNGYDPFQINSCCCCAEKAQREESKSCAAEHVGKQVALRDGKSVKEIDARGQSNNSAKRERL